MENENEEELKYFFDKKNYLLTNIGGRVIFNYFPKYTGILLGVNGIINGEVEQTIAGGIVYGLSSIFKTSISDGNERDNFKVLEKRLLNQMQNLNQTQNKEKTIR